ncbi:hypothetical protein BDR03DRAFT_1017670 [Suillus americanus]|nr:hypothetical protein BDR03DRAFT_1017670 [Suillus americanus]
MDRVAGLEPRIREMLHSERGCVCATDKNNLCYSADQASEWAAGLSSPMLCLWDPYSNRQNNNENARAPVAQITRARSFEIPDYLLATIRAMMPNAWTRANEALQNNTQLLGPVEPLVWTDEEKAFLVLWISRERRILETVLTHQEVSLGLRSPS